VERINDRKKRNWKADGTNSSRPIHRYKHTAASTSPRTRSHPLPPRTVSRGHSVHAIPTRTHYKIIISSTRPGPCCEASIRTKSYVSCIPKVGYRIHKIITSSHLETFINIIIFILLLLLLLLFWWRVSVLAAVVLCSAVIATWHEFDLR
jgi:hypothetical protein